ncbi:unnamed protein product [Adineta steineri]|uniref:Uncharacterized protein n=1 Tax=Adineta steineri TaxID=433720 RepID=A0A814Y9Y3_9BILA|nr:unnamed protein product [Adineta steineri]
MGLGSSQEYYEYQAIRPTSSPGRVVPPAARGVKRRRRRIFRRARPAPTTVLPPPVIPVRHHSPHRHPHRPRHYAQAMPAFQQLSPAAASSIPMGYPNYTAMPYIQPQAMMMPQQQIQPMVMPQQIPQSYPLMMAQSQRLTMQRFAPMMLPQQQQQYMMMQQQYMPQQQQQMMMAQEMQRSQPMAMPQQMQAGTYASYGSYPYGMNYSTPYAQPQQQQQQQQQQQPHHQQRIQSNYNIGASAPLAASMPGHHVQYSSPIRPTGPSLGTDWTGGGKISPGFLGPPL